MKIPLQSRKRGSINERLHLFAKDEKGYPFYQLALVATRRKRVPFFLSILLSFKTIGKGVTFKKYKTFSVLIYSYINTSGNSKNETSHNFEFFQFSRVLI